MSVEKLNAAEDPRRTLTAMQSNLTTINDAIGGLSALAMLIDGYQDGLVDIRQVVRLLDPITSNLRDAAEDMELNLRRTRGGMVGDRPLPGENDLRLCRLHDEFKGLWDQVHAEDPKAVGGGPAARRQEEIAHEMLRTPADTYIGAAAKMATAVEDRDEPESLIDKLEWQAARDLERLAGFGEQQQAAE